MKINKTMLSVAISLAFSTNLATAGTTTSSSKFSHVLLISVDGLHQNDLDWYVTRHPNSTMATLVNNGVSYKKAQTPFPSDSFPGMVGQVTGGNPATTGIYYDDSYNRAFYPIGTTKAACQAKTATLGAEVQYAENIDKLNAKGQLQLDAGQGITGLYPVPNFTPGDLTQVPTAIMSLKSSPGDVQNLLIDPSQLPLDSACNVVYPHNYLKVNTVFEVLHSHNLHTAWSDKHPAYEILSGPSGLGIDDLFAPEINSLIDLDSTKDWTKNNINTQKYDTFKVLSVINEIKGHDHAGNGAPGVPILFGMNFQAVSTAQKLTTSPTPESSSSQPGGYSTDVNGNPVPGPVLESALTFVDGSLKQMLDAINNDTKLANTTAIILSAKHGQSPQNKSDLTIINDGTLVDNLNTAWRTKNPKLTLPLVAHAMDDDGVLLWLNYRTTKATAFAKQFLLAYTSGKIDSGITVPSGIGADAAAKSFTKAGLSKVYAGAEARQFMKVKSSGDTAVPDVIGVAQTGSVYAGGIVSKIAEHGGNASADRHVPIVVWGTGLKSGKIEQANVETTQIAPTILHLLGQDPKALDAVKIEKTPVLPGL